MIGRVWLRERGETTACCPVKGPSIDNHASNSGAMPSDKLGSGMHYNISSMFQGLDQVGSRQGIIDNKWYAMLVGNISNSTNIDHIQAGIAYRFRVYGFGALVNGGAEVFRVAAIHKAHGNAELRQGVMEEVISTPIEAGRGDNFIACTGYIQNSHCFRRLT